jgi:hypothetical protein
MQHLEHAIANHNSTCLLHLPRLPASTPAISMVVAPLRVRPPVLLPVTRLGARLVPAIVVTAIRPELSIVTTAVEHQTRTAAYHQKNTNEPERQMPPVAVEKCFHGMVMLNVFQSNTHAVSLHLLKIARGKTGNVFELPR